MLDHSCSYLEDLLLLVLAEVGDVRHGLHDLAGHPLALRLLGLLRVETVVADLGEKCVKMAELISLRGHLHHLLQYDD